MSERENHIHRQEVQQRKAVLKAYKERMTEWQNIDFRPLWDTLRDLDAEIAQTEPDLIEKIQKREERINFYEGQLHDWSSVTSGSDEDFKRRIKEVLWMHQKNRDQLLDFVAEHKGQLWADRKAIWQKIEDLRKRHTWLEEEEIPRIQALLPPPTPRGYDAAYSSSDDLMEFDEWYESQKTDEQRRQEELALVHEEYQDQRDWDAFDKDEMELELTKELEQTRVEANEFRTAVADYEKRLEATYAQELVINDLREKFEEQNTAFAKVDKEYNLMLENLSQRSTLINDLGALVREADETVAASLQSFVDRYNVDLEFWDHDIQDPQFHVDVVQTWEAVDQVAFSNLLAEIDRVADLRRTKEKQLDELPVVSKEYSDSLRGRHNNAQEMLRYYKGELEKQVAIRAAEIQQALPLFTEPANDDGVRFSRTMEPVARPSLLDRLKDKVTKTDDDPNLMYWTPVPKPEEKSLIEEVTQLRQRIVEVEAQLETTTTAEAEAVVLQEEAEFNSEYLKTRNIYRFLSPEELAERKGVKPYIRARDALNEIEENGGVKGKSYDLRFPNRKALRKKVQNMIALRLGVEHTKNPIDIRITSRMDNTGNQVGCKFLIDGREITGIAMIYVGDEDKDTRTWYLSSVGHVNNALWEWCEDNTPGVPPGIKQETRQPLSYFIEMHHKIKEHFEKKKKASA